MTGQGGVRAASFKRRRRLADHAGDVMIQMLRPTGVRGDLPRFSPEGNPFVSPKAVPIFTCTCAKPHEVDEDDAYLVCVDCGLEWER